MPDDRPKAPPSPEGQWLSDEEVESWTGADYGPIAKMATELLAYRRAGREVRAEGDPAAPEEADLLDRMVNAMDPEGHFETMEVEGWAKAAMATLLGEGWAPAAAPPAEPPEPWVCVDEKGQRVEMVRASADKWCFVAGHRIPVPLPSADTPSEGGAEPCLTFVTNDLYRPDLFRWQCNTHDEGRGGYALSEMAARDADRHRLEHTRCATCGAAMDPDYDPGVCPSCGSSQPEPDLAGELRAALTEGRDTEGDER